MQWYCSVFIFSHNYLGICPTHPIKSYYVSFIHTDNVYIILGNSAPVFSLFSTALSGWCFMLYFITSFEGQLIITTPDRYWLDTGVLPSAMGKLTRKSSYNSSSCIWNGSALRTWKWMISFYHMSMANVSCIWCIIQLYLYHILILFVLFVSIVLLTGNFKILYGFSYKLL